MSTNENTPISGQFWDWMQSYWHNNRDFPPAHPDWRKKADLVNGKVPAGQLPSYVDDVLEFNAYTDLPQLGEKGKIYITTQDNKQFRWGGSTYIEINSDEKVGSKIINGSYNANDLSKNSITYGYSVTNAPATVGAHSFSILNLDTANPDYKMQLGFDGDTNEMFSRIKANGNWNNWSKYATSSQLGNFVTTNTNQDIIGIKSFINSSGNSSLYDNILHIKGTNGSKAGISFWSDDVGQLTYFNTGFHFKNQFDSAYQFAKASAFIKDGSDNSYLLLGGGGHIPVSNFTGNDFQSYQDNRIISPNELATQKLQFGFTSWDNNNNYPWADFLHFGGYQDSSGGKQNLIMLSKNGFGIRQYQAPWQGNNLYSDYVDYWHSGNFTQADVNSWLNMVHDYITLGTEQNIFATKKFLGATANNYNKAAIEVDGNGSNIYPSIGFHQPGLYAGTISMRNPNQFYFRSTDDTDFVYLNSKGYIKSGSDDNYILLGGGGHKLISDFSSVDHTHQFLQSDYTGVADLNNMMQPNRMSYNTVVFQSSPNIFPGTVDEANAVLSISTYPNYGVQFGFSSYGNIQTRGLTNGSWGNWRKLITSDDNLYVKKTGDMMSGGLTINSPDSIRSGNIGALPQNYKLFLANSGGDIARYGTVFWNESNGMGYIQQQRADGEQAVYRLNLQPYGGELYYGSSEVATRSWTSDNYIPKTHPAYGITAINIGNWVGYSRHDYNLQITPNQVQTSEMQFGFGSWNNNNNYPYGDYLHFGGYADSSGGNQNLIMFSKTGFGLRQWHGTKGSSANYTRFVDYWNTGNFTQADVNNWNTVFNNSGNFVTIDTPQHLLGQKTFETNFSVYAADGLFDSAARPLTTRTPGGKNVLLGYKDFGSGQYYPRIGFKSDTNWSIGLIDDDFTFGIGNDGSSLVKITKTGNLNASNIKTQNIFGNGLTGNQMLSNGSDVVYLGNPSLQNMFIESADKDIFHNRAGHGLGKIWDAHNFNPTSKLNATDGATAVGFYSGNTSNLPFILATGNEYVTLATAKWVNENFVKLSESQNFVTLNTAQTIGGQKTFNQGLAIGGNDKIRLAGYGDPAHYITRFNDDFDGFGVSTGFAVKAYNNENANLFKVTNTGLIKLFGDGRIDQNGNLILQQTATGGNATGIWWEKIDDSDKISGIGAFTQDGNFINNYMGWGNEPWNSSKNLSVGPNTFTYKGNQIYHSGNLKPNSYISKSVVENNNFNDIGGYGVSGIYRADSNEGGVQYLYSPLLHMGAKDTMSQLQIQYKNGVNTGELSYRGGLENKWGSWRTAWDNVNFNPELKANRENNAVGIGFDGGNIENPYMKNNAGIAYLATKNWITSSFIPKTHPTAGIGQSQINGWNNSISQSSASEEVILEDDTLKIQPDEFSLEGSGSYNIGSKKKLVHVLFKEGTELNIRELTRRQTTVVFNFSKERININVEGLKPYPLSPGMQVTLYISDEREVLIYNETGFKKMQ